MENEIDKVYIQVFEYFHYFELECSVYNKIIDTSIDNGDEQSSYADRIYGKKMIGQLLIELSEYLYTNPSNTPIKEDGNTPNSNIGIVRTPECRPSKVCPPAPKKTNVKRDGLCDLDKVRKRLF